MNQIQLTDSEVQFLQFILGTVTVKATDENGPAVCLHTMNVLRKLATPMKIVPAQPNVPIPEPDEPDARG